VVTVQTFLGHLEQDILANNAGRMATDFEFMHAAADKMAQLLDELLKLSRLGHQFNPPENVLFQDVVKEVLDLVAGRIAQRGVQVTVTGELITLHGDRARFVGLFQNLVDNACKFMDNQPAPRIEIGVETRGAEMIFYVRDNGGGIDPRHQAKVFGLFEKLNTQIEGTGMGLTLVKRIVELHNGRIWVESAGLGQGTCFYFTLPGAIQQPNKGDKL
jgi:signal transduction histidine kinase